MTPDHSISQASRPNACFRTTRWSMVLKAGASESDDARAALNKLIECYWYPIYAFARRKGNNDHDAMDLTQGYFAQLLDANAFESLSPEKGRFRSFLLASFTNFAAKQRRSASTIRRGGDCTTLSLTNVDFVERYAAEVADHETPELLFHRSWVHSLLDLVYARLRDEYVAAGKDQLFSLLEPHMTQKDMALPHVQIGQTLKMTTAAVAMSLYRMRRRYGELLREEVAGTLDDPADVEAELQELKAIIGQT